MKTLTVGDRVRVKSTGEVMVVEAQDGSGHLVLSKYGHMSGGLNIHPETTEVKREDVVKVISATEWIDDED